MLKLAKYLSVTILIMLVVASCQENSTNYVWPPDYSKEKPRPVITSIERDAATMDADSVSFAGVGIIYINGQNFSTTVDENHIYFSGEPGTILDASATRLTVKIPNVVGDSIKIQLSVAGALAFADYHGKDYVFPFRTKSAALTYNAIDPYTDASGLAVDAAGNVYVLTTAKKILKLTHPDSDAVEYGTATFITTPCMRMGPDSMLYLTRGIKSMYRTPVGGGKAAKFVSANNKVSYFDFDANKNLFAGGKGGTIEVVHPDLTKLTAADYTDYIITALRVFEGYVYVAATYDGTDSTAIQEGIWKNQILDNVGNLGSNELVVDWSGMVGETGPKILSFTFDADGEMYIGQDKDNAIYLLNAGTYFYPEILTAPTTQITWGNGTYFYINRHNDSDGTQRAIIRVETTKLGATYYGRP